MSKPVQMLFDLFLNPLRFFTEPPQRFRLFDQISSIFFARRAIRTGTLPGLRALCVSDRSVT